MEEARFTFVNLHLDNIDADYFIIIEKFREIADRKLSFQSQ